MNGLKRSIPDAGVALRKESVDRNVILLAVLLSSVVALRKESVDRNLNRRFGAVHHTQSLSARRAWIEIDMSIASTF